MRCVATKGKADYVGTMVKSPHAPLLCTLCIAATPMIAHPHVFVDTDLEVVVEEGVVTGVNMTWAYDEFFTLLILEDMGLDPDGDGLLTSDELKTLKGFDFVTWPPGFEGDLYMAAADGTKIDLGHPVSTSIAVTDGKIVAGHTRTVPNADAQGMEIRQYDPTFYVQYTLDNLTVSAGCRSEVEPYDPTAADRALAEQLKNAEDAEGAFDVLEMGSFYADRIRLTCEHSS